MDEYQGVQDPDDSLLGCYCDWGPGRGGACWDCCTCSPCCGTPCNCLDGCYCFWCVCCCFYCVQAKLLASSLDQPCAFVNHCLPFCVGILADMVVEGSGSVVMCVLGCLIRSNLRRRRGVGKDELTPGDFLMACCPCTSSCSFCQHLRSVEIEDWDWLGQARRDGIPLSLEQLKFVYEDGPKGVEMTPA